MANAVNILTIWGRATKDAETHIREGKDNYTTFDVAVNLTKDIVDFIPVVIFGNYGDKMAQYVTKGTPVMVTGSLRTSQYKTKSGDKATSFSLHADSIKLTGNKTAEKPLSPRPEEKDDGFMATDQPTLPF